MVNPNHNDNNNDNDNEQIQEKIKDEFTDINKERSKKTGLAGLVENGFRKFKDLFFALFLSPIAALYVFCLGFAFSPGIFLFLNAYEMTLEMPMMWRVVAMSFSLGLGAIFFILGLIIIVPIVNAPLIPLVRSYRGPWFSIESMPWYIHNALLYLVRYTVLDFITPSPLNIWFYRAMGMKIGKNVMINSSNISDACLIQLDDYVTIGGSAFVMAHYGMKGFLIIDKCHLKKGAMVGLQAKILGGVSIGEKAVVGPGAIVFPKTIIKDGEKFGVPAK